MLCAVSLASLTMLHHIAKSINTRVVIMCINNYDAPSVTVVESKWPDAFDKLDLSNASDTGAELLVGDPCLRCFEHVDHSFQT